jgi:hypothetical protein
MALINGLPRANVVTHLDPNEIALARINNQFVLKGTDPLFVGDDIVVFLEHVQAGAAFTINDCNNNPVAAGVSTPLHLWGAPMRLNGGVKLVGSIQIAKGFYLVVSPQGFGI